MLFRSSAYLLFWALGVIVICVLGFLVVDLGIFDAAFHTTTQEPLRKWVATLRDSNIDLALKAVALAFTIIFGVVGALKAWHYAEVNLGPRLVDFVERIKRAHLHDRAILLRPHASYNLRGVPTPTAQKTTFERILNIFRSDPGQKAAQRLLNGVVSLDRDLSILNAELERHKTERITAHLVEGLGLYARAKLLSEDSASQHSQIEAALKAVVEALILNKHDLDALEQAAKLAKALHLQEQTNEYLDRMERAAQEQKRVGRQARALRFQAEILEERSSDRVLNIARLKLESALNALDAIDSGTQDSARSGFEGRERTLERALANEQLGSLQLRRGKYTKVREPLDDAEKCYGKLPQPDRSAGLERIEALRAQVVKAEQGGDEPDDAAETTNELVPLRPTHVNMEPLDVSKEAGGSGAVLQELPPLTAVTLLEIKQDWALIAKEGETLGYVDKTRLHKLN